MEYIIYGVEFGCLALFLMHKCNPMQWITRMDLSFLRVVLPVLVIGGMIWGIVDRKPYDYGLSWEEKDRARSIALQLSLEEDEQSKARVPHKIDPLRNPETEYSIPLQNLLEGNHGRFF